MIPKAVREQAGLRAGTEVEVQFRDGRVEIEPTTLPMRLVKDEQGATIGADSKLPPLTADEVRDVLEHVRR